MMYIELQCAVILWSEPAQSNLYFNMSQATTNIYNLEMLGTYRLVVQNMMKLIMG